MEAMPNTSTQFPAEYAAQLDDLLNPWQPALGDNYTPYRNHCQRVLHFTAAFAAVDKAAAHKVAIAAAFHDLGIWTARTLDYLAPSRELAVTYLEGQGLAAWGEEVAAMIEYHHKLTRYGAHPEWLVEAFRRADWTDVSRGRRRFGLPAATLQAVQDAFPNAGFYRRLLQLGRQRLRAYPFSPLPMLRW